MSGKGKSEKELWEAIQGLDDDLLDPNLPAAVVDDDLRAAGIDPDALAKRGIDFVLQAKEAQRLSWQDRARERLERLKGRASQAQATSTSSREALMARLEELRASDAEVGTAIRMAARKRKPEESTIEELRALVEEMEALRSIAGDDED